MTSHFKYVIYIQSGLLIFQLVGPECWLFVVYMEELLYYLAAALAVFSLLLCPLQSTGLFKVCVCAVT